MAGDMGKALPCTALGVWLRWKAAKQGSSQLLINAGKEWCPQAQPSLEQFCRCEGAQSLTPVTLANKASFSRCLSINY